jgi:hypothetical protein
MPTTQANKIVADQQIRLIGWRSRREDIDTDDVDRKDVRFMSF